MALSLLEPMQQPQPGAYMWMPTMPLPQQQQPQQQQQQAPSPEEDLTPEKKDKRYANITSGSIPLFSLPRARLSEALDYVAGFDPAITADLDQVTMAVLVWCLTRVRPNVVITDLRSTTYMDLYETLKHAAERVKEGNETEYKQMIQAFGEAACVRAETVMSVAVVLGFEPAWLQEVLEEVESDTVEEVEEPPPETCHPSESSGFPEGLSSEAGGTTLPCATPPETGVVCPVCNTWIGGEWGSDQEHLGGRLHYRKLRKLRRA